jgi:hypothetical protein
MKSLILFFVLFIPFSLIAQDNVSTATTNDQTDIWMTKISSDSELRSKIMDKMIEKTDGNKEEMMKLVIPILSNPEMNKLIMAANYGEAENKNISIEPRGIMKDDSKVGKVLNTEPNSKK